MSKHTPGPWHVHKKKTEAAFRIDAAGDEWQELATVYQVPPYTHLMEQGEANAHLIAAAPEMLEVLQRFNQASEDGSLDEDDWRALTAAIAKAEGK